MKPLLTKMAVPGPIPLLAFIAAGMLALAAAAQDTPVSLDIDAIRARAQDQSADAVALAATIRKRGEAMSEDAISTASAGEANSRRYSEAASKAARMPSRPASGDIFDFDRLVADTATMAASGMGSAPRFVAFASTSMPPASLKAMLHDVTRAGGVVVFRGLPQGSVAGFTQALRQVLEPGESLDGVGIDPRLFRAFDVQSVPAYIVTASDFDLCNGFDCVGPVPPHDRISGNVTARYALETFAGGNGPGAKLAALHLARLTGDQP
ncbi:MAG: type-F conjugative transfer system pilin assembly protein TrbC [Novosphingobium sp.]